MLGILHSYFTAENSFESKTELRKRNINSGYVYRDDLDEKKSATKPKKRDSKGQPESTPLLRKEVKSEREQNHGRRGEEREGIKVKILMTKEEAARLLSKCKDGGVLEFKDVARELVQIPATRVSVVASGKGEDHVLGSIPEEF
ncbi:hypothetical protein Vadar_024463 [Vaccinium darrowii]|uniref:Uncharacterized protein n=1 Tax=Vaccinium darrowii TaxID=229202 RepID=A0ACB7XKT4_9ERIC|nr:hypothetical protein Vadar_024463 [Vaccinium darrowii]